MALISTQNMGAFIFGILGNVVSFVVFLAPLPTFVRVCKKKSTEGFQSIPYVVALFSAMLWILYGTLKSGVFLLITINSFGCVIETIYIALYIAYAPKQARMFTLRLLILLNFGGFCSILLLSHFLPKGQTRVKTLGWICTSLAMGVFAAPLSAVKMVVQTKSVEFMPFNLSFVLTINAIMWFFYGLLLKDFYIAIPNTLGFTFGLIQMVLYAIYRPRKSKKAKQPEQQLPEHTVDIEKQNTEESQNNNGGENRMNVNEVSGGGGGDHHEHVENK